LKSLIRLILLRNAKSAINMLREKRSKSQARKLDPYHCMLTRADNFRPVFWLNTNHMRWYWAHNQLTRWL
jgi:hypothetical protein